MNNMQILCMDAAGETGEVIFRTPCSVGSGEVADPRYPYTHAYDFIRMKTTQHSIEHDMVLPQFSRSQAAQICRAIAPALGMTSEDIAKKIADFAAIAAATEGAV